MRKQTNIEAKRKRILLINGDEEFPGDSLFLLDGKLPSHLSFGEQGRNRTCAELQTQFGRNSSFFAQKHQMDRIEVLRVMKERWGVRMPEIILSKWGTVESRRIHFELKVCVSLARLLEIEVVINKADEFME